MTDSRSCGSLAKMSVYGRKAAVPVQPKRPKARILKKAVGPSRRKLVEERSKSEIASQYKQYTPAPPAARRGPGSKPSPRPVLSMASMSYTPHPPPGGKKKKPSGRSQQRSNYLNIQKLKEELVSHHRTDSNLDKMRSEVGYAMQVANSLISDLSENEDEDGPQTTSRKGYANPMFEFYRKEAAVAAAARQRQKAVPRKAGLGRRAAKPNSMPLLMVPVVPPPEDSFAQELKRRAGLYADHYMPDEMDLRDRYRVGKVADRTIASLNDEISATVADCQRTVQMLTKLGADSPSMHNLFRGAAQSNNVSNLNQQIHQLNIGSNMIRMNAESESAMANMMTPVSQRYRLANYLPDIYNQRLEAPVYGLLGASPIAAMPPQVTQQVIPQPNGGYLVINSPAVPQMGGLAAAAAAGTGASASVVGHGENGMAGKEVSSGGAPVVGIVVANVPPPTYASNIVPSFRQVDPSAGTDDSTTNNKAVMEIGQRLAGSAATAAMPSLTAVSQDDEASVLAEAQKSLAQIERALSQLH